MRYLGNKTRLLHFIDEVIKKYEIPGDTFLDLFAGTGAVGDYLKDKYKVIANDYMFFSTVLNRAKLKNENIPKFEVFERTFGENPFDWFNKQTYEANNSFFVYNNYAPKGGRQYFTNENAIKIDGIRIDIQKFFEKGILKSNEYDFLLASLIESVTRYSNTSGTYQAFLKEWDKRALKDFIISPLDMLPSLSIDSENKIYNENANLLVRSPLKSDIAYIDPPYTITQYTNSYHVLETIAKYDNPELFGKTGRRVNRELSNYSNKRKALFEFEDLIRQLETPHILISYSNHSIVPLEELINLIKKFAKNGEVHIERFDYRSYATNNKSYKVANSKLQEVIIYFQKENKVNKSPLNYSGSKDVLLPKIFKYLPKHISTFVDCMGGAFNVGANVTAMNQVVYNEYNKYVYEIIDMVLNEDSEKIISNIEYIIRKFGLKKKEKDPYIKLREYYNTKKKYPLILFTLQIYSFQNMIRFNKKQEMNVPIGNNEFNNGTKLRLKNFKPKTPQYKLINNDYTKIDITSYPEGTVFYFDPPYYITKAEYNDGKRGLEGWNEEKEHQLFDFLNKIDKAGYKFMLSNVLYHKGKTHISLLNWVKKNSYKINELGKTGIKYPRLEILVTNYNYFD